MKKKKKWGEKWDCFDKIKEKLIKNLYVYVADLIKVKYIVLFWCNV